VTLDVFASVSILEMTGAVDVLRPFTSIVRFLLQLCISFYEFLIVYLSSFSALDIALNFLNDDNDLFICLRLAIRYGSVSTGRLLAADHRLCFILATLFEIN
jgi:hypothetical protein